MLELVKVDRGYASEIVAALTAAFELACRSFPTQRRLRELAGIDGAIEHSSAPAKAELSTLRAARTQSQDLSCRVFQNGYPGWDWRCAARINGYWSAAPQAHVKPRVDAMSAAVSILPQQGRLEHDRAAVILN
jgi:hypothetical protein